MEVVEVNDSVCWEMINISFVTPWRRFKSSDGTIHVFFIRKFFMRKWASKTSDDWAAIFENAYFS